MIRDEHHADTNSSQKHYGSNGFREITRSWEQVSRKHQMLSEYNIKQARAVSLDDKEKYLLHGNIKYCESDDAVRWIRPDAVADQI